MVDAPPLPKRLPPPKKPPKKNRGGGRIGNVYIALDSFTPEQNAALLIWLMERPMPPLDPIQLALAGVNALKDDDLALFFEKLRDSMDDELWTVLTE